MSIQRSTIRNKKKIGIFKTTQELVIENANWGGGNSYVGKRCVVREVLSNDFYCVDIIPDGFATGDVIFHESELKVPKLING